MMVGHSTSSSRAILFSGGNAEERPVGPARGCDEQDLLGAEPLVVEAHDGRPGLGIVEHPARLALDARRRGELARLGRGEQRIVRHRIPEKVGESCRQLPATRRQGRTAAGQVLCLDPEMKRGGLQDARDGERDRLVTRTGGQIRVPERLEPIAFTRAQGASIGAPGEALDAGPGAGLLRGRRQRGPVAAGKERRGDERERREVHRGQVQLLHLVGGWILALCDALEAFGARFGREPPRPRRGRRRRGEDPLARRAPRAEPVGEGRPFRPAVAVSRKTEQIGNGVVVLGGRQRQRRRPWRGGPFLLRRRARCHTPGERDRARYREEDATAEPRRPDRRSRARTQDESHDQPSMLPKNTHRPKTGWPRTQPAADGNRPFDPFHREPHIEN